VVVSNPASSAALAARRQAAGHGEGATGSVAAPVPRGDPAHPPPVSSPSLLSSSTTVGSAASPADPLLAGAGGHGLEPESTRALDDVTHHVVTNPVFGLRSVTVQMHTSTGTAGVSEVGSPATVLVNNPLMSASVRSWRPPSGAAILQRK
jgi:hypothetical protein